MSTDSSNISEQAITRVRKLLQDDPSAALAEARRCLEQTPDNLELRFLQGAANYRPPDNEQTDATTEQPLHPTTQSNPIGAADLSASN